MEFDKNAGDQTSTQAPTNDTDPLEALVGEGKPFKDIAALAKGKIEADEFVDQLKRENFDMRKSVAEAEEKLSRSSTTAEILEAVRSMAGGKPNDPPQTTKGDEGESGNQSTLTEDAIAELIQRTMSKTELAKTQEANYQSVKDAFVKAYTDPDKARLQYKAAALALDMTEDQLDSYAKQNPTLVLQAAGLKPAFKSTQSPPSYLDNPQNTEHQPAQTNQRDNSWWEVQRKEKGNSWYFQPKVQQMYWDDAKALGDSFL
jgi:hypothetical protein